MLFLAILFFPGTVLHELSHFFAAKFLFIHTGKITLWPRFEGTKSVTMGSVEVAKSDLFRNFLIGVAPFLVGTTILVFLLLQSFENQIFTHIWLLIGVGYLLFVIGNTMFSSKKDMEGAVAFYILIAILIGTSYFMGVRIEMISAFVDTQKEVVSLLRSSVLLLGVPIVIDLAIILITKLINRIRI